MFTAVSQSLTAFIAAAIFTGYLVTVTEQHPPKWFKPHSWDSPVKYSHLQYKPQLVHLVQPPLPKPKPLSYLPHSISLNKPFKTDLSCQLRKVVFTQDADSPQVHVTFRFARSNFQHRLCWQLFEIHTYRTFL